MPELSISERYQNIYTGIINRALKDAANGNAEAKAWLGSDYSVELCDWLHLDVEKLQQAANSDVTDKA